MKKLNFVKYTIFFAVVSCVENEFEIPETLEEELTPQGTEVTIASVRSNLKQSTENSISYTDTETYISGYVTSSDVAGNFYKELIIQDTPKNPTAGITLQLNQNALYTIYEPGRKIYVYLDGLTTAVENGIVQLGIRDGNGITKIPASRIPIQILRSTEVSELEPLPVEITDFSEDLENLYIQLVDAQFNRNEVFENTKTFAAEATDAFNGIRLLETCDSRGSTLLSTSTFAKFKSVTLPTGRGHISGILSRDFYDNFYILRINTTEAIAFDADSRCDPLEITCGYTDALGATLLFKEDFEEQSRNKPIAGKGWTNYIEYGTQSWEAYRATGTNASQGISARINSYQSGNPLSVCWLVTPSIDLATHANVRIRFETSSSFADASELDILLSTDWDGIPENIPQANWAVLSDAFVIRNQDFFGDWYSSGIVSLSCVEGQTGYVAFKYSGSGNQASDGTYQLDNISITAD